MLTTIKRETDPVLLEILYNNFLSIGDQMTHTLRRTGYTIYVKHTCDFGAALCTKDGEMFTYSTLGVTTLFSMPIYGMIKHFSQKASPGDIFITNDPYPTEGLTTHLPDIDLLKPIFYNGELMCYGWAFVHETDVGGSVPGSIALANSEIFQEGLRIAPTWLYHGEEANEELLKIIGSNVRNPEDTIGDIKAMTAALKIGEDRFLALVGKYGPKAISTAIADTLNLGEEKATRVIQEIPNGNYSFTEFMDYDGKSNYPVRIKVNLEVKDGRIHIDFNGTDPQVKSSANFISGAKPQPLLLAYLHKFLLSRDPTIPLNAGLNRPITVDIPKGTILNPNFPAAGGGRGSSTVRVMDAIMGALATAIPDKVPAAHGTTAIIIVLDEPDLRGTGLARNTLVLQPLTGSTGARPWKDGIDARDINPGMQANNPIEILEAESSVRITKWATRKDSGGAGKFRGGVGLIFEFQVNTPDTTITARGQGRFKFQPWGLAGGKPGMSTRVTINPGTAKEKIVSGIDVLRPQVGDIVRFESPGGGGYGRPFERDPESVLSDVLRELVSPESARSDYGVIIEGGTIDHEKTKAERKRMEENYVYRQIDFGPDRRKYDRILTSAVGDSLNELIFKQPPGVRYEARLMILEEISKLLDSESTREEDALRIIDNFRKKFSSTDSKKWRQ